MSSITKDDQQNIDSLNKASNRNNFTVPEPFQLATDRSSNNRIPKTPKPGQVRASFSSPKVPPKPEPKPATNPEPFRLESVRRHAEAVERLKAEIDAKEKEEVEKRKFKAQPIAPPAPVPPHKGHPPTSATGFKFACEQRAERRREFLQKQEEKELIKAQEKLQVTIRSQKEIQEEIREYRKNLNFKATPMPSFYHKSQNVDTVTSLSPKKGRNRLSFHESKTTNSHNSTNNSMRRRISTGNSKIQPFPDEI